MRIGFISAAKYTMLPGIMPRLNRLLFSGFGYLGVFIAMAYASLRLLPANHPYLNPANQGRFGVRHVMSEVRRRLVFDRNHSDQVILYYTLCLGFLLVCMQFLLMALSFSIPEAHAGGIPAMLHDYFVTENPGRDVAYNLLDKMFAYDNIFNSDSMGEGTSVHLGLHMLFYFYNTGILIVAAIVFLYMIITVVAETAESGVPFGNRFNGAWAPLRLMFAVGLLMPLPVGGEATPSLNGGQLLTMYVAKWGSSFGTNAWFTFLDNLGAATPLGEKDSLVVQPKGPAINGLVEFLFVARTCAAFQYLMYNRPVNGYIVKDNRAALYLIGPMGAPGGMGGTTATFDAAQLFVDHNNIYMRFGEYNEDYTDMVGHVRPVCGDLTFTVKDLTQPGALDMQQSWYALMNDIWGNLEFRETAMNMALHYVPNENRDPEAPVPAGGGSMEDFVANMLRLNMTTQPNAIQDARAAEIAAPGWDDLTYRQLGWAGAAIWYNKLAEMNGSFMAAVHDVPHGGKYPEVLETISAQKIQTNALIDPQNRFQPYEAMGNLVDFDTEADKYEAMAEYNAQQIWQRGYISPTNSSLIDVITAIFGLDDLFSMRDNIAAGVNPLAQIVGLGRGLLESSIMNLGYSFGAGAIGGLANIIGLTPIKTVGAGVARFTSKIGLMGLSIGFLMFYVIPFMPFIYFFFSLGTWVKSIFVGMIGIPLWGIAHMRIDGEGLPGQLGMSGYYLLFEIFLRPALTIIGLIGGLTIFGAQAFILDEIWDLVTTNLTGVDHDTATAGLGAPANSSGAGTTTGAALGALTGVRGVIDQFMYTIMYAIVIYMMGLSSFKMADMVPDNILRWMGAGITSFGQYDPNPAERVMGQVTAGLGMLTDRRNAPLMALLSRNS